MATYALMLLTSLPLLVHSAQQQPPQPDQSTPESAIPVVGLGIVFIFGSLLYGSILKLIGRAINIHYHPILLASGILLGVSYHNFGLLGDATHLVSKAHPRGILAIFLPCLIFESAFRTEWHVFKKLAGQSLILGVLSSIFNACLLMVVVELFLDPYDNYRWFEALMLGSILTCTDIWSFVNKLRRVGTPNKLTALIEGESLFNYCTCMMIFEFIQYWAEERDSHSGWSYLSLLLQYVLGGVLLGVVAGAVAVYCIKRIIYDGVLVVTVMAIFTYAIYLAAQYSQTRVSSLISVTVFSLYMNANAKTWLFGETAEYVHSFWDYLFFVAETSIFMIAGVLVGANGLSISARELYIIEEESVHILLIYVATVVSRMLSIVVFWGWLRRVGEGLTLAETTVLTVGGLKGAIGIALAMHVFDSNGSNEMGVTARTLTMIHVTANALLTLVVSTLLISPLVRLLRLSSITNVEYKFFLEYLGSFEASVIERKEQMQGEMAERLQLERGSQSEWGMVDWKEVERDIGIPQIRRMMEQKKELEMKSKAHSGTAFQRSRLYQLLQTMKSTQEAGGEQATALLEDGANSRFELEVEYRKRFVKDLIAKYWQFHDNNFTSPAALMLLIQSANYDLDTETEEMESWEWIKSEVTFNIKFFSELMKLAVVSKVAKSSLFEYVSFCYDVVSSYIIANEQVRGELQDFFLSHQYRNEDEASVVLNNILRESEENQKSAEFFLANYLTPSFPELDRQVKTRKVSFFVLKTFKDFIDKSNENGQLEPNEYDLLSSMVERRSLALNLASPKWQEASLASIVASSEVWAGVPPKLVEALLAESGEEATFDANERIIDSGDIAKNVYLVKRGSVIVEFTNGSFVYKEPMLAGEMFGFESMLTNLSHSQATANCMAQIVHVRSSLLLRIFECLPDFEERFWRKYAFECYKMFASQDSLANRITHLERSLFMQLIEGMKLEKVAPAESYSLKKDHIFIRGNVEMVAPMAGLTLPRNNESLQEDKDNLSIEEEEGLVELTPFSFVGWADRSQLRVKETSYFFVGEIDYELLQRMSSKGRTSLKPRRTKKSM